MSIIIENMDYTDLLFPIYLTPPFETGFIFLSVTTNTVVDRAKGQHLFPMNYSCLEWGFEIYPFVYILDMDIESSEVKIMNQSEILREIRHKPW